MKEKKKNSNLSRNTSAPPRTLVLMRHAKSDWSTPGLRDHDRPLNARGQHASGLIGRYMQQAGLQVDTVLASTATRAQQTLKLLQENWLAHCPNIISSKNLYLASPTTLLKAIGSVDSTARVLLVIAHNPGLEELVEQLGRTHVRFPTACVAAFSSKAVSWQDAIELDDWTPRLMVRPKDLEAPDSPEMD